MNEPDGRNVGY